MQTLATVLGMSLTMIAVALGIIYLFDTGLPLPAPVILLVFAIGFILGSVFFERRGAEHPWSLVGGALASMGMTFLVISIVGGILFIANGSLSAIPVNTVLYSLSACMIVSMVTLNFASYKLQYI
ncbi:MAG: heat-shock protein [ANME-2 cluster archaeon]|nr:heat-shock protein [ANME-2 cluster archaeon]